jgi:hypothetical protein
VLAFSTAGAQEMLPAAHLTRIVALASTNLPPSLPRPRPRAFRALTSLPCPLQQADTRATGTRCMVAAMRKRRLLTPCEIVALEALLFRAREAMEQLRRSDPIGVHLQLPKIPARLAESIVASHAKEILGIGTSAVLGDRASDLCAYTDGGFKSTVAVKGTGPARWVTLTRVDLQADCLVWVDYTERMGNHAAPLDVHEFRGPLGAWCRSTRVTLGQLTGMCPRHLHRHMRLALTVARAPDPCLSSSDGNDRQARRQPKLAPRKTSSKAPTRVKRAHGDVA